MARSVLKGASFGLGLGQSKPLDFAEAARPYAGNKTALGEGLSAKYGQRCKSRSICDGEGVMILL